MKKFCFHLRWFCGICFHIWWFVAISGGSDEIFVSITGGSVEVVSISGLFPSLVVVMKRFWFYLG